LHLRAIRRLRPDAVISFVPGDNLSLLAARRLDRGGRWALVVSENIHVSSQLADYPRRFRWPYLALMPHWYPRADAIVCVAARSGDDLAGRFAIPADKIEVIPNPIDLPRVRAAALEPAGHPWLEANINERSFTIVAAGRLERQKRFDVLLRALAELRRRLPARLLVLGEGPLRGELESLAAALGLHEHASFPGFQQNPYRFMARAAAFALSSDYEGFPLVVSEAMALGVPVVSTDCPTGPRELLAAGEAGLLVPPGDAAALATALHQALTDRPAAERRKLAALRLADQLDAPAVAGRYLSLARRVVRGKA
jgi:glycosyltransferase involved in cell wall biosynthesis